MSEKTIAALNTAELIKLRAENKALVATRDALRMENIAMRDTIAKYQFDNWHLRHPLVDVLNTH
jgi:hypothetical protein